MPERSAADLLLTALSWARGPGLPWDLVWLRIARALVAVSGPGTLAVPTEADAERLLARADRLIVEDVDPAGLSVFRLSHDLLATQLRAETPAPPAAVESAIVDALLGSVPRDGGRRLWSQAHPYLRSYLVQHAEAAGPGPFGQLLADHGFVGVADPITLGPAVERNADRLGPFVAVYRRARPLLGRDRRLDPAVLSEATLGLTGLHRTFGSAGTALYRTVLATVRADDSAQLLLGHVGPVTAMAPAVGPDGRQQLVSVGEDGTLRCWDVVTGSNTLVDDVGFPLFSVAVTDVGGVPVLFAGGRSGTVLRWDLFSGTVLPPLRSPAPGTVRCLAVVAGVIGAGTDDGDMLRWDIGTGEPVGPAIRLDAGVEALAGHRLTGDVDLLIAADNAGTIRFFDARRGVEVMEPLTGLGFPASALAVSPAGGGGRLAAVDAGGELRLWRLDRPRCRRQRVPAGIAAVRSATALGWDGQGRRLGLGVSTAVCAAGIDDGRTAPKRRLGHTDLITAIAFLGAGPVQPMATAGSDGTLRIWPAADPDPAPDAPQIRAYLPPGQLMTGSAAVLADGPSGCLAVAGLGLTVMLTAVGGDGSARRLQVPDHVWGSPVSLARDRDGRPLLVAARPNGDIVCTPVDVRRGVLGRSRSLRGTGGTRLLAVTELRDGSWLVAFATADGRIGWADPGASRRAHELAGPSEVTALAFVPGAVPPAVAVAHADGVSILGLPSGDPRGGTATGAEVSAMLAAGTVLATARYDGTVELVEPADPPRSRTVRAPVPMTSLALLSPLGRPVLAGSGDDGIVRRWDLATLRARAGIPRRGTVLALAGWQDHLVVVDSEGVTVLVPTDG